MVGATNLGLMIEIKAPSSLPRTLGELKKSGWRSQSVKEEIRINTVARIKAGQELFSGVLGFEDTVMPQVENALLAGHDIVFFGRARSGENTNHSLAGRSLR